MSQTETTLPTGSQNQSKNESIENQQHFQTLDEVVKDHILLVLGSVGGNKAVAAKILGVSVKTLYNKLDMYGVHKKRSDKKDQM